MAPEIIITSALPYANGPIHIGHLVEYIQTDIYVRFLKLQGKNAAYCCAGDTHGTPIEINARKQGISPEELVEKFNREHQEDFARFAIRFDSYYSTNSDENKALAEKIYHTLQQKGYIYEQEIEQLYSEKDQRFLPDRFVKGTCPKCGAEDQYGDVCEKCGATYKPTDLKNPYSVISGDTPILKKSTHLFFKLSEFSDYLRDWLTNNERLQKEVRNQILGWIDKGLEDWCISRDGPYFGFKIPETDKYFYVWLDAPIGYISSLANLLGNDIAQAEKVWNSAEIQHFIGKDISYFHLLFWPAVLHAAGWKVPDTLVVHGFLTVDGEKMSKSRGTFITAKEFAEKVPDTEFLRFYYAANLGHAMTDVDLNLHDFQERVNKELIGNVANLIYRALSFTKKNYNNAMGTKAVDQRAIELEAAAKEKSQLILQHYENYEYRKAVQELLHFADLGNQYLQACEPWKHKEESQPVLTTCLNLIKDLTILLSPILPNFAQRVQQQLNLEGLTFAQLGFTVEKHQLGEPEIIWRPMEPLHFETKSLEEELPVDPSILDLIVAKITKVEKHPKADKLYIEHLDDGSGYERAIVSGLVGHYTEEELVGKQVVIVNNLKPAKLRGVESKGMLLAAEKKGVVEVIEVPDAAPGTPVDVKGFEHNKKEITIDDFFRLKIVATEGKLYCEGAPLEVHGTQLEMKQVLNGKVA
jgi:methionyl-tRNA synthetase